MNLEKMNRELLEEVTSLKSQNLNLSKKNKELKKQLSIPNVSQCNELLCDFLMQYDDNITIYDAEVEASTFIQMQKHNCG